MQNILQHLFKENTLQEIPVETLQAVTKEYPFFAVGQYLLARKLKEESNQSYDEQFQKTLVYFNNPLWLQYQLSPQNTQGSSEVPVSEQPRIEVSPEIPASSHDLIEEVILHQEHENLSPVSLPDAQEKASEAHSAELISSNKESVKQTIQREEPFTFQAYYTVDYFASQGIKLSQDAQPNDKLGKQLKSFTEWLKTMRRLPETSVVEILHKINEGEIAQIAAHSLEEKEVATEAMAEVFVKQGKFEKATAIYNKLSLLNPHKNTYFAAKIGDLKQQ